MPLAWQCVRAPAVLSTGWEALCLLSPVLSQQGGCSSQNTPCQGGRQKQLNFSSARLGFGILLVVVPSSLVPLQDLGP